LRRHFCSSALSAQNFLRRSKFAGGIKAISCIAQLYAKIVQSVGLLQRFGVKGIDWRLKRGRKALRPGVAGGLLGKRWPDSDEAGNDNGSNGSEQKTGGGVHGLSPLVGFGGQLSVAQIEERFKSHSEVGQDYFE
jgi:hypothetical protein